MSKLQRCRLQSWYLLVLLVGGCTSTLLPNPLSGYGKSSYFVNDNTGRDDLAKATLKLSPGDIDKSLQFGIDVVKRLHRLETNLQNSDITIKDGTTAHSQAINSNPEQEALEQGTHALIAAKATIHLMDTYCYKLKISNANCAKLMTQFKLGPTKIGNKCDNVRKSCSPEEYASKYRSVDGACNHKSDGNLGQSFTAYSRLLFPDYMDGVYTQRRSVTKRNLLPSPRTISSSLVRHDDRADKKLTLALMQWGQFIGHDLYHTTSSKMIHSGESIQCCSSTGSKLSPRYNHPLCAPIAIPSADKFYSKHNQQCMTYVRSVPAMRSDCTLGPLDQLNQATHFLDGSQIYGINEKKLNGLRKGSGGELRMSEDTEKGYLPLKKDPLYNCPESSLDACFEAGDSRVNSQPQLTAMHTLWNREHNRIAKSLSRLNPHWNDEQLFQETRRVVIAELQHITYNEWLPNILSRKYVSKIMGFTSYNDVIDPSISNSFSTAAFRFLKSLMASKLTLVEEDRRVNSSLKLGEQFNKPEAISKGLLDYLVRGMATQRAQKADFLYVEDVTNLLYGNGKTGFDVVSLDIQRGRDHGLPSYAKFRALCGLSTVKSFNDFVDYIPKKDVQILSQIYKDPNDVDLFVGGMLETSYDDSLLGPTFSCIMSDQFLRTRSGDHYFYSFPNQPNPFTKKQLEEIRKVTLARVFCDNGDAIKLMQGHVFNILSKKNDLMKCDGSSIPSLNLDLWKQ